MARIFMRAFFLCTAVRDNGELEGVGDPDGSVASRAGMSWADLRLPRTRGRISTNVPLLGGGEDLDSLF
jgi:hypothetical protein